MSLTAKSAGIIGLVLGLALAALMGSVAWAAPPAKSEPAAKAAPPAKAGPAAAQAGAEPVGFEAQPMAEPRLFAMGFVQVALVLMFAAVVFYVCNWTFLDVRFVNTNQPAWNATVLSGGLAGLAAALLVPVFYIGLPLGILIFGGAVVAYAQHRNALVTDSLKVLTSAHLARIKRRISGKRALEGDGEQITGVGRGIIFMGMDDLPLRMPTETAPQGAAAREVERVLYSAIIRGATAIGYLARPRRGEVRFRIGGEPVPGGDVESPAAEHFAAAVKHLVGLDPNEVRKPQEGRLRAVVAGQTFDLRVKTAGTVRGEQIAIRIIDVATSQMRLEEAGLTEAGLLTLREALAVKPGLVIVSGPKDSGLTTTIHACLRHYDRYMNNVIAFEPHVDVEVENVTHITINQEDGPVAAAEVRSRIRMEPDIVAFDTLYLPEVAQVLAEAIKDHTVLVGVRAADTSQAMTRLAALFGSAKPLAERLQVVVNQRLVRLLCPDCREAYRPNPEFLRKANLGAQRVDMLYRPPTRVEVVDGKPAICPRCRNERYVGRTGLFEVMPIDAMARELIGRAASAADVRTYARKSGMKNLQEEGLEMVIDGRTSIEEVLRAIKQAT